MSRQGCIGLAIRMLRKWGPFRSAWIPNSMDSVKRLIRRVLLYTSQILFILPLLYLYSGIRYRRRHRVPKGPCLIVSNHNSHLDAAVLMHAFPFRRIEKLRNLPPEERDITGMVTYVVNLFPNATLAMLSNHTSLSVSEPLTPELTRFHTWKLGNRDMTDSEEDRARIEKDASFVADTGLKEDNDVIRRIQLGLASGVIQ